MCFTSSCGERIYLKGVNGQISNFKSTYVFLLRRHALGKTQNEESDMNQPYDTLVLPTIASSLATAVLRPRVLASIEE